MTLYFLICNFIFHLPVFHHLSWLFNILTLNLFALKKLGYLLVISTLFISGCEKDDQAIVDIPDGKFLNALMESGVDINGDGVISIIEAEAIVSIDWKIRRQRTTFSGSD